MWKFISDLNTSGRTIILTTHYLEEAESLCRNIAIIDHGKIIENTSMKEFLRKVDRETYVFDVKEAKPINDLEHCNFKVIDDTTIQAEISKEDSLNKLFEHFKKNSIEVLSMRRKTARLEELFMSLVNRGKK